jgi:phage pi2 protein 07
MHEWNIRELLKKKSDLSSEPSKKLLEATDTIKWVNFKYGNIKFFHANATNKFRKKNYYLC